MTLSQCGHENREKALYCATCGASLNSNGSGNPPRYSQGNPAIATMVSFLLPAGGQFYNRDFKKALAILGAYVVCGFIAGSVVALWLAFLLALVIWGWAVMDAYAVAKQRKALW